MDECYAVTYSFFKDGIMHTTNTDLLINKQEAEKHFDRLYASFLENFKKLIKDDAELFNFEKIIANNRHLPEKGKYVYINDIARNDKTIRYVEDNITKMSLNINYYYKPIYKTLY